MKKLVGVMVLCLIAVGFVMAAPVTNSNCSIDWTQVKGAAHVRVINNNDKPQTVEYTVGKEAATVDVPAKTQFDIPYKGKEDTKKAVFAITKVTVVAKPAAAPAGTVTAPAPAVATAPAPAATPAPAKK
jgi:hypothetical protein